VKRGGSGETSFFTFAFCLFTFALLLMFFSMMVFLLLFVGLGVSALIWVIVNNQRHAKQKAKRR
jgi:uncharacterized membrane protein